jgi:hypothetical protein
LDGDGPPVDACRAADVDLFASQLIGLTTKSHLLLKHIHGVFDVALELVQRLSGETPFVRRKLSERL